MTDFFNFDYPLTDFFDPDYPVTDFFDSDLLFGLVSTGFSSTSDSGKVLLSSSCSFFSLSSSLFRYRLDLPPAFDFCYSIVLTSFIFLSNSSLLNANTSSSFSGDSLLSKIYN